MIVKCMIYGKSYLPLVQHTTLPVETKLPFKHNCCINGKTFKSIGDSDLIYSMTSLFLGHDVTLSRLSDLHLAMTKFFTWLWRNLLFGHDDIFFGSRPWRHFFRLSLVTSLFFRLSDSYHIWLLTQPTSTTLVRYVYF